MRKPSKSLAGKDSSWQVAEPAVSNGTEGRLRRDTCPLLVRENL